MLYVAIVLGSRFMLKCVKLYFNDLYNDGKTQMLTNKVRYTLMLTKYDFYLKVDKVEVDTKHQQDVSAIDDMRVDDKANTLAQLKKHLEEIDNMNNRNEIEKYLIGRVVGILMMIR